MRNNNIYPRYIKQINSFWLIKRLILIISLKVHLKLQRNRI